MQVENTLDLRCRATGMVSLQEGLLVSFMARVPARSRHFFLIWPRSLPCSRGLYLMVFCPAVGSPLGLPFAAPLELRYPDHEIDGNLPLHRRKPETAS